MRDDLSALGLQLTDEEHAELEQRAADFAAAFGLTLEDASQRFLAALRVESPPLAQVYVGVRYSRWKRLIPGWRRRAQRQMLAEIESRSPQHSK